VNTTAHKALLADMKQALLAEFGARAIYAQLARRVADSELADVLAGLHQDEVEQVERLRALMTSLGATPAAHSRRRAALAWMLALSSKFGGRSLALRSCHASETTLVRWYWTYANYLIAAGEIEHARTCEALGLLKQRHARTLSAWVRQ
jgi:hypothetical protein